MMDWRPQKAGKQICPNCSHTRRKKKEPCLSVSLVENEFVWFCHNPGCGFKGGTGATSETQGMAGKARDKIRYRRKNGSDDHNGQRRKLVNIPLSGSRKAGQSKVSADIGKAASAGQGRQNGSVEQRSFAVRLRREGRIGYNNRG